MNAITPTLSSQEQPLTVTDEFTKNDSQQALRAAAFSAWHITEPDESFARAVERLIGTLYDASERNPLLNLASIFGPVSTWFSPFAKNGYSEFKMLDLWRLGRAVKYLTNTLIP